MEANPPVVSVSRWAARPVGAARCTRAFFAFRISTRARRMVVLPVPGPPVRIDTLLASAFFTAARCRLVKLDPGPLLRPFHRGVDLDRRQAARRPPQPGDGPGDLPLETIVLGKLEKPVPAVVPHQLPQFDEGLDPRRQPLRGSLQQAGGVFHEPLLRKGGVPFLLEGLEGEDNPGVEPRRGVVGEAEVDRDPVGGLEADALDLPRDAVRLVEQDGLCLAAVAIDQLDALSRGHPVSLKEDVQLALGPLCSPRPA